MEHDASYKLLFSHARMVEDLLRGFVHEAWIHDVDFITLERVSDSHISDDLHRFLQQFAGRLQCRACLKLCHGEQHPVTGCARRRLAGVPSERFLTGSPREQGGGRDIP